MDEELEDMEKSCMAILNSLDENPQYDANYILIDAEIEKIKNNISKIRKENKKG